LLSSVEAGIRLECNASNDVARLRSAYPGQYVSQSLSQPGFGLIIDDQNVSISDRPEYLASLSHGEVYAGAFFWDSANDRVDTGVGIKFDSSGIEYFVKSR
jgi:hypothetical protein